MEQVGENRRAAGRESPSGSSLAPRGLTGLLNPLSIWHKIISVVFHGLFQLYSIPSQGCSTTAPCARKREPAHHRPMPNLTGATFDGGLRQVRDSRLR
jgi:hypothetical protein